jgi:hypothetical protein
LFRLYPFEGQRFWEPVSATFRHRGTAIEPEPIGLTQAYSDDPARAIQWRAFVRRSRFGEEAGDLARLIGEIRSFALPVLSAVATGNPFGLRWKPGGPGNKKVSHSQVSKSGGKNEHFDFPIRG